MFTPPSDSRGFPSFSTTTFRRGRSGNAPQAGALEADGMTEGDPNATVRMLAAVCPVLKEGLFAEAVEALEKVLEMDFEHPGASSALKCAAFWKERLEKERAPKDGFERGELLLAQWRFFQAFAERLGDVPEGCTFAIKQFVFSSALACYLSAELEQGGGDADVLLQIGRCCKGIGNYERAIENLERANDEKKDDPRILSELADCYSLVNEERAAKVFFRESFFIDAQAVDLAGLESPMLTRLIARLRAIGHAGSALAEWVPVYGAILGVFSVKREMKPLEFGKLKQAIYQLEKDCREASAKSAEYGGAARVILVPRLINRYIWLIDHYMMAGEPRDRVEEVLGKIRELDPRIYREYTT
jgi:tetratricopeptide (TPR) repeat protein